MYCPNCGTEDRGDNKFCTRCGTNLKLVSTALAGRSAESEDDSFVRKLAIQQELVNQQETLKKRHGMITGGIISGCVGLGIMIFLTVAQGPQVGLVGMVPFMVGVGLTLSALLLFKPKRHIQPPTPSGSLPEQQIAAPLHSPLPNYPESVTAGTTRRLEGTQAPSHLPE